MWEFDFISFIQTQLASDPMSQIMRIFSYIGEAGLIWIALSLVLIIFKKTRLTGIISLVSLLFLLVLNEFILKEIFDRARPFTQSPEINAFTSRWFLPEGQGFLTLFEIPHGPSFMSSHTVISFAAATIIFMRHKKVGWFSLILAAFISFSRIYFGVHFPTDVLFGMLFAVAFSLLFHFLSQVIIAKFRARRDNRARGFIIND